jgi:hypothetical protein
MLVMSGVIYVADHPGLVYDVIVRWLYVQGYNKSITASHA